MSLVIENITSGYNRRAILNHINLEIASGSFTSLLGPNGSGKSTLLKTIAQVIKAQSGTVTLNGNNLFSQPLKKVARQLSFLPQRPVIPQDITVDTLVGYGRAPYQSLMGRRTQQDNEKIDTAIEQTGLNELRTKQVKDLSGGQQQRCFIAMNLAQDTDFLLLDEPTTFLDIKYQYETLDLLKQLNEEGRTIIVVLHDLAQAARYSSDMVMLSEGMIHSTGKPKDVMTPGTIKEVFDVDCEVFADPQSKTPLFSPLHQ
jgi:iron complex transport system ATP-binding protein